MTSIYQRALGDDFQRLHPKVQERFGFTSTDGVASIGTGTMERIWRGPFYTLPFLYVGTWRRIMFPEQAENVPFSVENYAYRDSFGRETVTWIRKFHTPRAPEGRPRRFDATMIYSEERELIVDYLGSHQHLAVDIHLAVDEETGGLRLRSEEQRFYEGPIAFRFPMFFSGIANVLEWYDDEMDRFRIRVEVRNPVWGKLFGYHGAFDVEQRSVEPGFVPEDLRPVREERRE